MLTGSGVDEAWTTGTQLGEAVLELLRAGKPFTQENLAAPTKRGAARAGWSAGRSRRRTRATDFMAALLRGLIGMALAGLTRRQALAGGAHSPGHRADSPLARAAAV